MNVQIDTAGMAQDRVTRKKQRFVPEGHMVHSGNRETSKKRQQRLEKWMRKFSEEQLADQRRRYWASVEKFRPGATQRVPAWAA